MIKIFIFTNNDVVYQDLGEREKWIKEFANEGARYLSGLRGMEYAEVREFSSAPAVLIKATVKAANELESARNNGSAAVQAGQTVLDLTQQNDSFRSSLSEECLEMSIARPLKRRRKSANSVVQCLIAKLASLKAMIDFPDELIGVDIKECDNKVVVECRICNCKIAMKGFANFSYIARHVIGDRVKTGNCSKHLIRAYRRKYEDTQWDSIHLPSRAHHQYKSLLMNQISCLKQDMRHRAESEAVRETKNKYIMMRENVLEKEREKERAQQHERICLLRQRLHASNDNTVSGATVIGPCNEIIYEEEKISCARHGKSALEFSIEMGTGRITAMCTACETDEILCYVVGVPAKLVKELANAESCIIQANDHVAEIIRTLLPSNNREPVDPYPLASSSRLDCEEEL